MKAILCIGSLVGLLGSIAVACSSTPVPVPPDSNVQAFCGDWGTAYCQVSSVCQFDATACATFQTGVCNQFATAAMASGDRTYSQPGGKACIDMLNQTFGGSPSTISAAALQTVNDTCNLAFVGNQALNASCTNDYDCQSGMVCGSVPNESSECSVASGKTIAGEGCADHGDQCQGNLYCAASSNGPVCTATPAIGAACSATIPCGTNAYCGSNGLCTAAALQGQPCTATTDCATGLYCDTYPPAVCVTELTFGRAGADCDGILGTNEPGNTTPADAGVGDSAVTVADANVTDSAAAADAAGDAAGD